MRRAASAAAALVVAIAALPQIALADGDPASDVLVAQSAFLPSDWGASGAQEAELGHVLAAASQSGYAIRLAVIASPSDLGSITALWRQPQFYARFLDQELSLAYKGRVLVVMPNGLGLAGATPLSAAERSVVARARTPITRSRLASVALTTIAKLAAASGHTLPASALRSPVGAAASDTGSTGPVAYVALAIGAVLIALAWGASLRARPLQMFRGRQPTH